MGNGSVWHLLPLRVRQTAEEGLVDGDVPGVKMRQPGTELRLRQGMGRLSGESPDMVDTSVGTGVDSNENVPLQLHVPEPKHLSRASLKGVRLSRMRISFPGHVVVHCYESHCQRR